MLSFLWLARSTSCTLGLVLAMTVMLLPMPMMHLRIHDNP
jgi:hypothetical protein